MKTKQKNSEAQSVTAKVKETVLQERERESSGGWLIEIVIHNGLQHLSIDTTRKAV